MKTVVSYEQIQCDMCGQSMSHEPSTMYVEGIYVGEKYVTGVVDVKAVFIGEDTRCLCSSCRKQILEAVMNKFT